MAMRKVTEWKFQETTMEIKVEREQTVIHEWSQIGRVNE